MFDDANAPHDGERRAFDDKKRRQRNIAIALGVSAFMAIVFLITLLRISGNAAGH